MSKFIILLNGELKEYCNYEDIPESFDNLISFQHDIDEGPHTQEQHDEISKLNGLLQDLMKRETK